MGGGPGPLFPAEPMCVCVCAIIRAGALPRDYGKGKRRLLREPVFIDPAWRMPGL
jgi:hypothetical protein